MPKNVAIILAWPYFGFLRHDLPHLKHIVPCNDLKTLLDRKIPLNSQGQKTADYIVGTAAYGGILREYFNRGHQAEIIEERFFLTHGGDHFNEYDHFDMQFTANPPAELVRMLESRGKRVIGWSPPELGSKAAQAALLERYERTSVLLPKQMFFLTMDQLARSRGQAVLPAIDAEFLIAKPLYASRSRMPDGSDYRVFPKSAWPQFVELALAHPSWFSNCNGLVISELIQTRDVFLNNHNAVLHKVHIPAGLSDDLFEQWPLSCRKMSARIDPDRIGSRIREFGEVFTLESWQTGHLEEYRPQVRELKNLLPQRPCLYSVDIMIRPDGRMCFLEFNKLAGTFIEKIYGSQCPLGLYMENLAQMGII